MAKYNIYGHVLYSEIEYEKLMYMTEKIFIQSLMNRVPNITEWIENIWENIDHEYMIKTLEEIKKDIITQDIRMSLMFKEDDKKKAIALIDQIIDITKNKKDFYRINPIQDFKHIERKYAKHISKAYETRIDAIDTMDEMQYLTEQIKDFHKLEETIVYKNNRAVTPSTYLSMLYNVNLTRTAWNQTFKDADYFEKDITKLEYHPLSCPKCAPMQEKLYSISGKSKIYPSIQKAFENGVGHPNCKCQWSILWDMSQMDPLPYERTTEEDYIRDQKKKATERVIRRAENDLSMYQMIGNGEMVDKTMQKIERLQEKLG